jgi:hypothetical protein
MANLAEFSPISEISTEKTFWNLRAKVIRLWQVSDLNRNTLPYSNEMVLMDEAGNRIHATIKKTLLYKFKNDIFEGKCYSFENMGVANNGGNYRTTRHPFKLNFQFSSKVSQSLSLHIILFQSLKLLEGLMTQITCLVILYTFLFSFFGFIGFLFKW